MRFRCLLAYVVHASFILSFIILNTANFIFKLILPVKYNVLYFILYFYPPLNNENRRMIEYADNFGVVCTLK